jgi:hypothetical protein
LHCTNCSGKLSPSTLTLSIWIDYQEEFLNQHQNH